MSKFLVTLIILGVFCTHNAYSQIDDIFDKTKKEIEKVLKDTSSTEKKKKKEVKKEAPKIDTACINDVHRMHKGEILFCTQTDPDPTKDVEFVTSFTSEDDITGIVYQEKIIGNYECFYKAVQDQPKSTTKCFMVYYIDGVKESYSAAGFYNANELTEKVWPFKILNGKGGEWSQNFYSKLRNNLKDGDYKIRIELWGGEPNFMETKAPIASGEFTYSKIPKPKEKPSHYFSEILPGMKNSRLEQQAIDAVNEKASRENWKERYSKATITSYDWYTIRNEWTGIITGRSIDMVLYGSWPDGECRMTEFSFYQDYNGSTYSSYLQYNGIGSMTLIFCE